MNRQPSVASAAAADADVEPVGEAAAQRVSPSADLRQSIGWIAFGVVVVVLSWRMDRLERQDINPYTVPGLLPGFLGLAVVLFGALLLWRSWQRLRLVDEPRAVASPAPGASEIDRTERKRIGSVLFLCIGYAAGLMGHGLPFWLATSIFIAVAIGVLQFADRAARAQRVRGFVFALGVGVATGIATTFLFQNVFLVRLP